MVPYSSLFNAKTFLIIFIKCQENSKHEIEQGQILFKILKIENNGFEIISPLKYFIIFYCSHNFVISKACSIETILQMTNKIK